MLQEFKSEKEMRSFISQNQVNLQIEKINGISQLAGNSIESGKKVEFQPLLGILTFEYHILLVFSRQIAVVSYITNRVLYWIPTPFAEIFREKLQLEEYRKRIEN